MSERSYFDLRNAVPGYCFILIILSINYFPILDIIRRIAEIESIFGTALSLDVV